MTGCQKILTDPSYKGQIITMTYPLIGNYGVSDIDNESDGIHAFGLVIKDLCDMPSNSNSVMSLDQWLRKFLAYSVLIQGRSQRKSESLER